MTFASPAFQAACAEPAGATSTSPSPSTRSTPSTRRPSLPERTSKRSSWRLCTWSGPVVQPGEPIQSTWSSSPPLSRAVLRNTVLSPVTGFISSAPALAMPCPPLLLSVFLRTSRYRPRRGLSLQRGGQRGRRSQGGGGSHVVPRGPLREVLVPEVRSAGILGGRFREPFVERDVA